nr:3-oxoacyl-ACP synthase [Desulfobacteraceae bacterium]
KYGNTTAGTLPIALDEIIEKKLISPEKSTIIFSGLGAGVTWGAMIFRFM